MLLEELRVSAQKNKEKRDNDPESTDKERSFADLTVEFLSNTDYIKNAPKSTVMHFLYYLGYEIRQLEPAYDELIKEVTRKHPVVSPEQLAEIMKQKEKEET